VLIAAIRFTINLVRKSGGAPDVHSGHTSQLAPGANMADVSADAQCAASQISVSGRLTEELGIKSGERIEDLVTIATPFYGDWKQLTTYEGFTSLSVEENEKSLFIKLPHADGWFTEDFTQAIVALIELAEDILECDKLYVCVDRRLSGVNNLVHSFLYVDSIRKLPVDGKYIILAYET